MQPSLRYPSVSAGYAGHQFAPATLNSRYFFLVQSQLDLIHDPSFGFPQRVPRTDFFKEISELEPALGNRLETFADEVTQRLANSRGRDAVVLLELLLRLGRFDDVLGYKSSDLDTQYVVEVAKINRALSEDESIELDALQALAFRAREDASVETRLKIDLPLRFVVSAYRYTKDARWRGVARELADFVLELLRKNPPQSFHDYVLHSKVYRGVAMVIEYGPQKIEEFMLRVEPLGEAAVATNELQSILKAENLLTGLQSLTKWSLAMKRFSDAERYLKKMIGLDPVDSTGHCELAFFYQKQKRLAEARDQFLKAADLGPPAVGMNLFFAAETTRELGEQSRAIELYRRCTEIDPYAVSPWLALIEIYQSAGQRDELRGAATHVLNTPDLREQLEPDEYEKLSTLLSDGT